MTKGLEEEEIEYFFYNSRMAEQRRLLSNQGHTS